MGRGIRRRSHRPGRSGRRVKQRLATYVNADRAGVLVLLLDRYTAPRTRIQAADAGGLLAPHELAEWLYYLDRECAE